MWEVEVRLSSTSLIIRTLCILESVVVFSIIYYSLQKSLMFEIVLQYLIEEKLQNETLVNIKKCLNKNIKEHRASRIVQHKTSSFSNHR